MPETISIKEQIKKLIELQKIDTQIYVIKRDLRQKPQLLEDVKTEFEKKKTGLKAQEDKYKSLQLDHKNLEGDLRSQEESISKANGQLMQLKTNKEYTAKIGEIESIKANKSIVEEKILLSFDALDAAKGQVEKEKALLADEEKKYLAVKKNVEDEIKKLDEQVAVLVQGRAQALAGVSKGSLSRYERILEHTDGLGIVPIQQGCCSGCFMKVPAQVANQIKMSKELVFCENCARIIYLEEDL